MIIYYPSYIFIRNKYFRWYRSIVENSVERNKNISSYTENHHILPKSIFPEFGNLRNHKWNRSKLTFREHFLAHWLLSKCMVQIKHREQMFSAISKMNCSSKDHNRIVSSWQYEIVKRASSDANVLRWQDSDFKDKTVKSLIEANKKPETKKRKSDAAINRWSVPGFRQKITKIQSKASKLQWKDPKFLQENTFHCSCCDRTIVGKMNWNKHLKCKAHLDNQGSITS